MKTFNVEEFKNLLKKDTISLDEDITIERSTSLRTEVLDTIFNTTDSVFVEEFSGVLDGNNHTIHGLPKTIFKVIRRGGVVKNLTLDLADDFTTEPISKKNHGTVKDVTVKGNISYSCSYLGGCGLVRDNTNVIENCTFTGNISCHTESPTEFVGGIVASNTGTIKNCVVQNSVIKGICNVGGFAGKNEGEIIDTISKNNIIIGLHRFGGIAGLNKAEIFKCITEDSNIRFNTDERSESKYGGGISGVNTKNGVIDKCKCYSVNVEGHERTGGISGNHSGQKIKNSVTDPSTEVIGIKSVGGLIGVSNGSIIQSISKSNVKGEEKVGGIAGELNKFSEANKVLSDSSITGVKEKSGSLFGVISRHKKVTKENCHYYGDNTTLSLVGKGHDTSGLHRNTDLSEEELLTIIKV